MLTSSQWLHLKCGGDMGGVNDSAVGHLLVQADRMVW